MKEKEDYTLLIAVEAMLANNMRPLRDQQVMTSEDVARLYEVKPEYLQKQVCKNTGRFPRDFMLRLTKKEQRSLQTAYPNAFTEKGIFMAGGLLKSERAIKIHIQFIRYFVKLCKASLKYDHLSEVMNTALEHKDTEPLLIALRQLLKDKNAG